MGEWSFSYPGSMLPDVPSQYVLYISACLKLSGVFSLSLFPWLHCTLAHLKYIVDRETLYRKCLPGFSGFLLKCSNLVYVLFHFSLLSSSFLYLPSSSFYPPLHRCLLSFVLFICLFFFFWDRALVCGLHLFRTHSHFTLSSNSQSFCLCLLSPGSIGTNHHYAQSQTPCKFIYGARDGS